jgi:hypothetical protein
MTTRRTSLLAAFALLALFSTTSLWAQATPAKDPLVGTWIVFVTIDGAPPCQCIAVETYKNDNTIEGPATDHFSGDIRGVWARTGNDTYAFTLGINNYNPDGTGGGMFVIKNTATVAGDSMSGKFTFQILANGGGVLATGTGSFTATRMKAQ